LVTACHGAEGEGVSDARRSAEVFPPRVFALEEKEARGWTVAELADRMGMPEGVVVDFLVGRVDCTPDIAAALG
jgi:plasmid maintenance system antidote protein VapI